MRTLASGLLVAIAAAACLPVNGPQFHTTLTLADGSYPLPVALGDETGVVVGIEPGPPDMSAGDLAVYPEPIDANAFVASWLGGMCDSDAELSLLRRRSGPGYVLAIHVNEKLGLGCPRLAS